MQYAAIAAVMCVSAPAAADTLELEGAVAGAGWSLTPAFRFGVVLSERVTLGAGLMAYGVDHAANDGWDSKMIGLAIPVDLKLWISPPRPGGVAPTLRFIAQISHQEADGSSLDGIGGGLLLGAAYMLDDAIGISIEGGGTYMRFWGDDENIELFDINYRASLILRI